VGQLAAGVVVEPVVRGLLVVVVKVDLAAALLGATEEGLVALEVARSGTVVIVAAEVAMLATVVQVGSRPGPGVVTDSVVAKSSR